MWKLLFSDKMIEHIMAQINISDNSLRAMSFVRTRVSGRVQRKCTPPMSSATCGGGSGLCVTFYSVALVPLSLLWHTVLSFFLGHRWLRTSLCHSLLLPRSKWRMWVLSIYILHCNRSIPLPFPLPLPCPKELNSCSGLALQHDQPS